MRNETSTMRNETGTMRCDCDAANDDMMFALENNDKWETFGRKLHMIYYDETG